MARIEFQHKYFAFAPKGLNPATGMPFVLNVGSCDDPLHFGEYAMHVDLDDWSYAHKHFTRANIEKMPFADRSFHTVILGDILEHVVHPLEGLLEAARVCDDTLVVTIFEEWRLPGLGQFIKEGQARGDQEAREQGAADRLDWQRQHYPQMKMADDVETPHLIHINAFTDADVKSMVSQLGGYDFLPVETWKVPEGEYKGHVWSNWLLSFMRVRRPEVE